MAAQGRRQQARDGRPHVAPACCHGHQRADAGPGSSGRTTARLLHGLRTQRRSSEGCRSAAGGHVHVEGLLQRQGAVDRSALLPLQQPGRHRRPVGRQPPQHDRRPSAGVGRVGLLRPRRTARLHREPVPVQDRRRALRGTDGRDQEARRPDEAPRRQGARGLDRPLHAPGPHAGQSVLVPHAARADDDRALAC